MGNVFRCYVEKKPGFAVEAEHLFGELRHTLGLTGLTGVRVLRRYDVEGVDAAVYAAARTTVLSEPQVDALWDEVMPAPEGEHTLLAVEALPGQYDQRADSCAQCIQMMHGGERPTVRAATVYVLEGTLKIVLGGNELYLQPGDSLYYDSSLPHVMYAVEGDCRFIAVVIKEGAKA